MPVLTVFTPTYNRAHKLERTYESLCRQDCKDFVWLIIDDGSTDHTKELVEKWELLENGFEIRYIYKENGGVHTAHNTAYENIGTELCMCIDSDDAMADGAAGLILSEWKKVREKGYAGLIGLDVHMDNGEVIGNPFPENMTETTWSGYYALGGLGDKKPVYRTDVITSVSPYPVFKGEKYMSLTYKYLLVDQKCGLYVVNKALCRVEYQPDGTTNNMHRQYLQNPKGFAFLHNVMMQYPTSKKGQFIDCIHYVSSSQLAADPDYMKKSPKKFMTFLAIPFAWSMTKFLKNIEADEQKNFEHMKEEERLARKEEERLARKAERKKASGKKK